jgi:hypothetical protein
MVVIFCPTAAEIDVDLAVLAVDIERSHRRTPGVIGEY